VVSAALPGRPAVTGPGPGRGEARRAERPGKRRPATRASESSRGPAAAPKFKFKLRTVRPMSRHCGMANALGNAAAGERAVLESSGSAGAWHSRQLTVAGSWQLAAGRLDSGRSGVSDSEPPPDSDPTCGTGILKTLSKFTTSDKSPAAGREVPCVPMPLVHWQTAAGPACLRTGVQVTVAHQSVHWHVQRSARQHRLGSDSESSMRQILGIERCEL
jgi:hypothetical protein